MNRSVLASKLLIVLAVGIVHNAALAQHQHDGHGHGAKDEASALAACPVMDEPIDFGVNVATSEGPVFFCCSDCVKKYQKNPAKYAKKANAQREALADTPKVQVTCPVSGEPVEGKVYIEHEGQKVYFCCKDCVSKFQADPVKYQSKLANSYSYQTLCPVMGEEIDPKAFAVLPTGQTVFFCCGGCDKKFLANPAKYTPKLASQGIHLDPAKIAGSASEEHAEHQGHGDHDHDHGSHD